MIEYDDYDAYMDDDDDDIDLMEIVSADFKISNQYLIFEGSSGDVFGISVTKVRELISIRELTMLQSNNDDSIVRATADIRDEMTTIINFDEWFGNTITEEDQYELVILTGFGGKNIGIMIKSVEYIVNIDPSNMYESYSNRDRTNFVAKIKLNNQDRLCTIFDCDKMLLDTFELHETVWGENVSVMTAASQEKTLLFADDSRLVQQLAAGLFEKLQVKAMIFKDGKELLDTLKSMPPEDVGLIVTDLEMPMMDGFTLIDEVRELTEYDGVAIVIHSNIGNDVRVEPLRDKGVADVISKIDMNLLAESIKKHFR